MFALNLESKRHLLAKGSSWVMPCGVACIDGFDIRSSVARSDAPDARSRQWIVVSDTLGTPGLALLALTQLEEDGE